MLYPLINLLEHLLRGFLSDSGDDLWEIEPLREENLYIECTSTDVKSVIDLIEFLDRYRSGVIVDPRVAEELLKRCRRFMERKRPPLSREELIQMIRKTRQSLLEEPMMNKLRNIYRLGRALSTLGIFATIFPLLAFMLSPSIEYHGVIFGAIALGIVMINLGYPLMIYVRKKYYNILEKTYARQRVDEQVKKYVDYLIRLVAEQPRERKAAGELTMTLLNPDYECIKVLGKKGKFFVAVPSCE